jgi:transaldolase/glucose-6-phosphate isomerase
MSPLGVWLEQLIAESTGKEGKGIIPVVGEALGGPEVYGNDRLFVAAGDQPGLAVLEAAGHPVVGLPDIRKEALRREFFRWEFATAVAGHVLGINPFDQPNVEEAKDATQRILANGTIDLSDSTNITEQFARVRPGDYIAVLAYLTRSPETRERLASLRLKLRDRFGVATTVGFGPRYLHSTGQIHKGGPRSGFFIQLTQEGSRDLVIPGRSYSFGALNHAQAAGDREALTDRERRVVATSLYHLEQWLK